MIRRILVVAVLVVLTSGCASKELWSMGGAYRPTFTPDGKKIVFVWCPTISENGDFYKTFLPEEGPVIDGKKITYVDSWFILPKRFQFTLKKGGCAIARYDIATKKIEWLAREPAAGIWVYPQVPIFSRDAKKMMWSLPNQAYQKFYKKRLPPKDRPYHDDQPKYVAMMNLDGSDFRIVQIGDEHLLMGKKDEHLLMGKKIDDYVYEGDKDNHFILRRDYRTQHTKSYGLSQRGTVTDAQMEALLKNGYQETMLGMAKFFQFKIDKGKIIQEKTPPWVRNDHYFRFEGWRLKSDDYYRSSGKLLRSSMPFGWKVKGQRPGESSRAAFQRQYGHLDKEFRKAGKEGAVPTSSTTYWKKGVLLLDKNGKPYLVSPPPEQQGDVYIKYDDSFRGSFSRDGSAFITAWLRDDHKKKETSGAEVSDGYYKVYLCRRNQGCAYLISPWQEIGWGRDYIGEALSPDGRYLTLVVPRFKMIGGKDVNGPVELWIGEIDSSKLKLRSWHKIPLPHLHPDDYQDK